MSNDFKFIALNDKGRAECQKVEEVFNNAYAILQGLCPSCREFNLVFTKLQEASYFAKKAVSLNEENWLVWQDR